MKRNRALDKDEQRYMHDIFARYEKLFKLLASKYTGNDEEQKDLTQDTLLRLMDYINVLRSMSPYKVPSYISLTMRSVFISKRRHEKSGTVQEVPYDDEILLDAILPEPDPYQSIEVKLLLDQLSEHDRLLLKGWYITGWTAEELAAILGCSKDSIRMKLTRARKRALEIYREEPIK